ncbi:CRISPR-associated protein Cas5 [Thermodesulforhabdus norvegica]|uniref:CRISPR-associated protein Cas5h n=1 Tax=Thermodesulforhabdus norvegica TaxID=39841 RepID=A0A1I4RN40_9BACT|nr:CRISPR-associated protein Cas5 [Thermodesulforhabdus norvegica]SFM53657.1 CRISPR-associated protein Cas5h [Thermodesulforhabdus norvegica]
MAERLYGFIADAELPYFACFRKPASTSVILTYPVPPFTTIVGMIANALGIPRPGYFEGINWLQNILWLNLRPITKLPRPSRELAKILKLVGENREERRPTSFPSSPMYRYFLPRPYYRFFVASEDREAVDEIVKALGCPERPLYLGQSDDMVVLKVVWCGEVEQVESREAWGLVRGSYEANGQGTELLRLPIGFESERKLLLSPLLTLPSNFPFLLPQPESLWRFAEETVHLISAKEARENASGEKRAN